MRVRLAMIEPTCSPARVMNTALAAKNREVSTPAISPMSAMGLFAECAHQLALRQDVSLHGFEQLVFIRSGGKTQEGIQCVQFEEVAMSAGGRAGTGITGPP